MYVFLFIIQIKLLQKKLLITLYNTTYNTTWLYYKDDTPESKSPDYPRAILFKTKN